MPGLTTADKQLMRRNGLIMGDDFLTSRQVVLVVEIAAQDDESYDASLTQLLAATNISDDETELIFRWPGVAGREKAQIFGRVRRRNINMDRQFTFKATVSILFEAGDPRIYSNVISSAATSVAAQDGGLEFPLVEPVTFGGVNESGELNITNSGTFATHAVFRIDGPCTSPRLENVSTGDVLELDISLSLTDFILVDTNERQILLNGAASRYSRLSADSKWFDIAPGLNTVKYRASTSTGSACSVTWRSAYV